MVFNRFPIKRLNSLKETRSRQAMLTVAESDHSERAAVDEKWGFLKELEDFKSSIDLLRDLMAEMQSSYERAENVLQEELKKKEEMLHTSDSAIEELEESVHILRSQLSEKEALLKSRDGELEGLTSEVNDLTARLAEMETAKERADNLLQSELRRKEEMLQLRDSAARELKENLSARIRDLGTQLSEKEELLKTREGQLEVLRFESNALMGRLAETESAYKRTESLLQNELKKQEEILQVRDSATKIKELRENLSAQIQNQGSQPTEKKPPDPFEILLPKSR
jgi:chromosome segregation ATPase